MILYMKVVWICGENECKNIVMSIIQQGKWEYVMEKSKDRWINRMKDYMGEKDVTMEECSEMCIDHDV